MLSTTHRDRARCAPRPFLSKGSRCCPKKEPRTSRLLAQAPGTKVDAHHCWVLAHVLRIDRGHEAGVREQRRQQAAHLGLHPAAMQRLSAAVMLVMPSRVPCA